MTVDDLGVAHEGLVQLLDQVPSLPRGTPEAHVFPDVGDGLFAAIRAGNHRKLVLQVPAGLVRNAHDLAARIHREVGVPTVVLSRACFGACDFPSPDEAPGADAAVVLGHAPIPNVPLARTTYFVEMRSAGGDPARLAQIIDTAGLPRKLGLVASVQHLGLVPRLVEETRQRGFELRTASGDLRLFHPGQALGCNYTSAQGLAGEVEGFVFLGTGRFHPVGLAFAVDRPVWSLDPLQATIEPPIDRGALVRQRQLMVARCRDARRWGMIVSSFSGQNRHPTALALQRRARERGWDAEILLATRVDPRDLEGRDLDAYVNTACPRIATDDATLYQRPILTPPEFLMVLGELPMEPYRFDTFH